MKRLLLSAGVWLAVGVVIYVLHTPLGVIPPLANFFDPFRGFWANAPAGAGGGGAARLRPGGLRSQADIVYDDRGVAHVFAGNDRDAYFAQGYVTARDRLWQMDFQARAAAGRLAEVLGAELLGHDRQQRSLGIPAAAQRFLDELKNDAELRDAVEAYSEGVNAHLRRLRPADYPVEFKLMNYAPEEWTPFKTACIYKQMTWDLTGPGWDLRRSRVLSKFGEAGLQDLFPPGPVLPEPSIKNREWPFTGADIPRPAQLFVPPDIEGAGPAREQQPAGSNSWVVSAQKSETGYPMLANDPHLDLQLPSIWYELQIASPSMNVYGATIPGVPNVIIGFNRDAAWGITAAEADVSDWYHIKFKDDSKTHYWYNGQWAETRKTAEVIKVRGGAEVRHEVVHTHHGPVVREKGAPPTDPRIPEQSALRWLGYEASRELRTFYTLNRARGYDDFVAALSFHAAPPLNFTFASRGGDIALWHRGDFPLRWRTQGTVIGDGSDPAYEWHGRLPLEQNPHVRNPPENHLSSANQYPVDESYPHYLPADNPSQYRAKRIEQLLQERPRFSPQDFQRMQTDALELRATRVLPVLLRQVRREELGADEARILDLLANWDFHVSADSAAPTVFTEWMRRLNFAIWQDELSLRRVGGEGGPAADRTTKMILEEPDARWFDNVTTPEKETLPLLAHQAFRDACHELARSYGSLGGGWEWGNAWGLRIPHMAGIDGLGTKLLRVSGSYMTVNDVSGRESFGPSWRMVVAFNAGGVRGWGALPGGQSGDPASAHYDDLVGPWLLGQLGEFLFLESASADDRRIVSRVTLEAQP